MILEGHHTTLTICGLFEKIPCVGLRIDEWELVNKIRRTNAKTSFGMFLSLGQKSTQPESLILAQSERWRQA